MKERTVYSGFLLVISGFSGSGKDSVADKLQIEGWERVVTHNAGRDPRPGEVHGVHYYFVSNSEFERMKQEGELLEYVDYAETKKGTSRKEITEKLATGKKLIWRIDPTAAANVREIFLERMGKEAEEILQRTKVVFLRAESDEILLERARKRKKDEDLTVIERRIREDNEMWERLKERFEHVIVNKENSLDETVEAVRAIVSGFLV